MAITLTVGSSLFVTNNVLASHQAADIEAKILGEITKDERLNQPELPPFPVGDPHKFDPKPASPAAAVRVAAPAQPVFTYPGMKPVPVLMYHHIRDYKGPDRMEKSLSVSPASFSAQMGWLKNNGYRTLTLPELFAGSAPSRSVVVAFDDGYQDNYDVAFHTLAANGQKAVFFVISNFPPNAGSNYMNIAEVQEMSGAGMDIESHTVIHTNLSTIGGAELAAQLTGSKTQLEGITGKSVNFIAYPNGGYNAETLSAAAAAGYKGAFTIKNIGKSNSNYELPRITIGPGDNAYTMSSKMQNFIYTNARIAWNYR